MANKNSTRIMEQRKANYDRVSIIIDKGGKYLLHALAKREGVGVAEMARRAILARAGLHILPYPDELERLKDIATQEEAAAAINLLQAQEESSEIVQHLIDVLSPEAKNKPVTVQMDRSTIAEMENAMATIGKAMAKVKPDDVFSDPVQVQLTGYEVGVLRRFLANIHYVE